MPVWIAFFLFSWGPATGAGAQEVDAVQWLDDVSHIISSRDREIFRSLSEDRQRQRFIEVFWKRLDQDPSTERNEFREEHYRRLEYARKHFANARPGDKTDRGRIYILHGEPDERLRFASSRTPMDAEIVQDAISGNTVSAVPETLHIPDSEMWTYRYLSGLENLRGPMDVLFMRVSAADARQIYQVRHMRGRFMGQSRLNTLLYQNNGLFNGTGSLGQDFRMVYAGTPRFINPLGFLSELQRDVEQFPYTDIAHAANEMLRSPGDLMEERHQRWRQLREEVRTGVYFETFPASLDYFFLRSASGYTYIPLHISVPGPALDSVEELTLLFEMRRGGQLVAQFGDKVSLATADRQQVRFEGLNYQTRIAVQPGLHQMDLHVIDRVSRRMRLLSQTVQVPDLSTPNFNLSSLVLCKSVLDQASARLKMAHHQRDWVTFSSLNPLKVDQRLLVPAAQSHFRRKDVLTVFFEVYEPVLKSDKPDLQVQMRLLQDGRPVAVSRAVELRHLTEDELVKVSYASGISIAHLKPGDYRVQVQVHDRIGDRQIVRESGFSIL